jgi:hypothetical protein
LPRPVAGNRRGRFRRTEDQPLVRPESIDNAAAQRQLGTDDREIDRFARGEIDERIGIRDVRPHASRERRDAGVARRAHDFGNLALARKAPRQGMFASTAADDKNSHRISKSFISGCLER